MTITTEQVDLLNNRFGALAYKVQLGTLIQNAESVAASEIALAEGKVLVGNSSGVAAAATLTSAQILVGNGSSVATPVAVTGDVTISNAGVTAIASGVVIDADVKSDAAIAYSKLAALASARLLVGSAGNVATAVDVTGDVTIGNTGVTAIGAAKVTASMLAGFTHTAEGLNLIEKMAVVVYDFAVDGGAQSTIASGVTLPDNAVVTGVIEDVYTSLTSAGSGATIKLNLPTDGDLSADVTADGTNVAVASVLPSGTPVKLTAAREIGIVIGTEAITAGAARWFIKYVQSV